MTRVLFLGTAGYHPSEARHTACVFLPEQGIVLDAGTGFFRLIDRIETDNLNILISHAHLDHTSGLVYIIDILYKHPGLKNITVHAMNKHIGAIKTHLYDSSMFPVPPMYDFRVTKENFEIGNIKIKTMPLEHKGDAQGYRLTFQDGKTMAYITDTAVHDKYLPLIKNVDLLIHECNFLKEQKEWAKETKHSYTTEVAALAKDSGVKKLVLFHFNPLDDGKESSYLSEAQLHFPDVIIAQDLMEINL